MKRTKFLMILIILFIVSCTNTTNKNLSNLEFESYSLSNQNNVYNDFVYDISYIDSADKLKVTQNMILDNSLDTIELFKFSEEDFKDSKILILKIDKRSTTDILSFTKVGYIDSTLFIEATYEKVYWHVHMCSFEYSFIKIPNNLDLKYLDMTINYKIQQNNLEEYENSMVKLNFSLSCENGIV